MGGCILLFPDLFSTGQGTSKTQLSPANAILIIVEFPRELFRGFLLLTKKRKQCL